MGLGYHQEILCISRSGYGSIRLPLLVFMGVCIVRDASDGNAREAVHQARCLLLEAQNIFGLAKPIPKHWVLHGGVCRCSKSIMDDGAGSQFQAPTDDLCLVTSTAVPVFTRMAIFCPEQQVMIAAREAKV